MQDSGRTLSDIVYRRMLDEAAHKPHFWGSAEGEGTPYRCLGVAQVFFYRRADSSMHWTAGKQMAGHGRLAVGGQLPTQPDELRRSR